MNLTKLVLAVVLCAQAFAEDIPDEILFSVYRVKSCLAALTSYGSAISVDLEDLGLPGKRYLITAAHVVSWDMDKDKKVYSDGVFIEYTKEGDRRWIDCKILVVDDEKDICLLEANEDLPFQLQWLKTELKRGQEVMALGCPTGLSPVVTKGYVGDLITKTADGDESPAYASTSVFFGNSGGAIIRNGAFAGVVVAIRGNAMTPAPNVAVFVPLSVVKSVITESVKIKNGKYIFTPQNNKKPKAKVKKLFDNYANPFKISSKL